MLDMERETERQRVAEQIDECWQRYDSLRIEYRNGTIDCAAYEARTSNILASIRVLSTREAQLS